VLPSPSSAGRNRKGRRFLLRKTFTSFPYRWAFSRESSKMSHCTTRWRRSREVRTSSCDPDFLDLFFSFPPLGRVDVSRSCTSRTTHSRPSSLSSAVPKRPFTTTSLDPHYACSSFDDHQRLPPFPPRPIAEFPRPLQSRNSVALPLVARLCGER
jgi:hypothetical protein